MEHTVVRRLIANVEHDLLAREVANADDHPNALVELRAAWAALVTHLAVPPAPEVRVCSHCGGEIRSDATICKFCWAK